jgi:hypothetical protein
LKDFFLVSTPYPITKNREFTSSGCHHEDSNITFQSDSKIRYYFAGNIGKKQQLDDKALIHCFGYRHEDRSVEFQSE